MRARNIKPGFFTNELLATSDPLYAWVYAGMWCMADREGRLEDRPRHIHLSINPGRAFEGTVESLNWLIGNRFVRRYSVAGVGYLEILAFAKHQNPHANESPRFPPPNGADEPASMNPEATADVGGAGHDARSMHKRPRETIRGLAEYSGKNPSTPVQAPEHSASAPADSLLLIPSSLIPSSLIPDPGFQNPSSSTSVSSTPPSRSVEFRKLDGPVVRIFEHWKATWNHPRAKLDPKRQRIIATALKRYTETDLRACIVGYLNSSHHCGENDRRAVYDDIGLLLRDAAHIDAGLAFGEDRRSAKPELILRTEAEFHAYEAATKEGLSFASQDEWEAHARARQTH